MDNLTKALTRLVTEVSWSHNGTYSSLKLVGGTKPTQAEVDAMIETIKAEEAVVESNRPVLEARRQAYLAKGWLTVWDYIDDQTERGAGIVNAERKAIKQANPKVA